MRFRQIDASNIGDHARLRETDECYYLHEYTSGAGYAFGEANSLVSNLKKPLSTRGTPQYRYKLRAIETCSELLRDAINPYWIKRGTFVPIPPSKAKDDPLYDDRLVQICKGIATSGSVDVRELVLQGCTTRAAHECTDNRLTVEDLEKIYQIDERETTSPFHGIAIVDDVLTAGTHFKAMQKVLEKRLPGVSIVGLFIARRIFPTAASIFEEVS